ncbi:MAG: CHRD domain-containing protein [Verrucomicrobiales bacterium]|nr:CHRD domain-containing protein [Verrucomicrobiales bacterium]MCP5528122.1 CHRD domain-containing protein [Verrucomicrobiales bacterium]
MKKLVAALFLMAVPLFAAGPITFVVESPMSGFQEDPVVITPGFGAFSFELDPATGDWNIGGNYYTLSGSPTSVGIYGPAFHSTAGGSLIASLTPLDFGLGTGMIYGSGTFTPAQLADVMAEHTYVNVFTSAYPGGEIRGQILVPEPSTYAAIAGLGLLGFAAARRFSSSSKTA